MVGPSPALIQANAKVHLLGPGLGPLYIKKQTNKQKPTASETIPNEISVSKSDNWILGPGVLKRALQ